MGLWRSSTPSGRLRPCWRRTLSTRELSPRGLMMWLATSSTRAPPQLAYSRRDGPSTPRAKKGKWCKKGRGVAVSVLLLALIHRSAWKENSAKFVVTEFSEVRGARDLSHKPAPLRLLDVPRRLYPRPHDLAVLRCPSPCASQRVVLIVDHGLQAVDLRLGQLQRVHERVSHGILLLQVPAHDGRALGRVVRRAHGVLGILQVPDVKPLIHPVRRPGEEDELFPEGI